MIFHKKLLGVLLIISAILVFAISPAFAAGVSASTLQQLFDKLDTRNNGNWYKDYNNKDGVLAWDESYVMRAYLEMYEATKNTKYLDKFIVHADSVLKQRDSERGVKDYRGLSLPAWSAGNRYTKNGTLKIFEVHTAMIAYPYARFATIVNQNGLNSYKSKADIYLKAAKDAVAVHDDQWVVSGNEMYMNRPFNMFLSLGSAYLEIFRASGDTAYRDKAVKIANHFKNNLSLDSAANSYVWKYMRSGSYTGNEDLSHGAIDVDFVNLAYQNDVVFTQTDMVRFGNTIEKKLIKADGSIADKVSGTGTSSNQTFIGLWVTFYPWAPSLFNTAYQKVAPVTAPQGEDLLSAGLLNKAYAEKNGGVVTPPVDPPTDSPSSEPKLPPLEEPTDATGDSTAPAILWYTPANGADNVPADAEISVRFSEGVKNVDNTTFKVSGVSGQVSYDSGTNTAVFKPDQALALNTSYSVTVGSGITDLVGNHLYQASWTFTTKGLPPVITLIDKDQIRTVQDSAEISAQVKDDNAVSQVVFSYAADGAASWTSMGNAVLSSGTDRDGVWSFNWDLSSLADDTYYIKVKAVDKLGDTAYAGYYQYQKSTPPPTPPTHNPTPSGSLINGDFSSGTSGWSGTDVLVKKENSGNQYASAVYGWAFYQDLSLEPGDYKLTADTRKGTSTTEAPGNRLGSYAGADHKCSCVSSNYQDLSAY